MKQKKISTHSNQLKRCLLETESNLNKIGVQIVPPLPPIQKKSLKKKPRHNSIYVRDAISAAAAASEVNQNGTQIKMVAQNSRPASALGKKQPLNMPSETITTTATTASLYHQRDNDDNDQHVNNIDAQIFHPYDSLHLKVDSISSKKRNLSDQLIIKQLNKRRPSDGHINLAFMNDYEYYNNNNENKTNIGFSNR